MALHPVGPFELLLPLGRGGMGAVYRARHVQSGQHVALKTLDVQVPHAADAVAAEVRAMAGLDHPNVVWVYDHGVVSLGEVAKVLKPGTQWIAMQLADRGTLRDVVPKLDWAGVARVLDTLLLALGHAHARGVIHRDLKPGNVLFTSDDQGPDRLLLADFGLAVTAEVLESAEAPIRAGTPSWMAPEQLYPDFGVLGPWSDLYAVGTLAWWMLSGRIPFKRENKEATLLAKASARLPAFRPRIEVPRGLEDWLRALLERRAANRVGRAADARWALQELCAGPREGGAGPIEVAELDPSMTPTMPAVEWTDPGVDLSAERAARSRLPLPPPPMPSAWPEDSVRRASDAQVVAGLALYGLRDLRVVGRHAERDALWDALRRVHRSGRAAAMVLTGPTGVGKSRLAQWLGRTAHEQGVAEVFRAVWTEDRGGLNGLAGLAARALRAVGLEGAALGAYLRTALQAEGVDDAYEVGALRSLIDPMGLDPDGQTVEMSGPTERAVVALQTVARGLRGRIGVLWLDDVHHALEAVRFAARALDSDLPLMVVCTAREGDPAASADAELALEELQRDARVSELPLAPLGPRARRALFDTALKLAPHLVVQLDERAGGNPLFATQLLGAWVGRGVLEPTAQGFDARTEHSLELPADLAALGAKRVDLLLADHPRWRLALEAAAALGLDVGVGEWTAVCAALGVPAASGLVHRLLGARLAALDPAARGARWSFAYPIVREAVAARCAREGRLERVHAACVQVLSTRGAASARLAHHLELAGALDRAADAYIQAWEELEEADPQRGKALLHAATRTLEALGRGDGHRAWRVRLMRASYVPDSDDAPEQTAREAEAWALEAGDQEILAIVDTLRGAEARRAGRHTDALAHLEAAVRRSGAASVATVHRAWNNLGLAQSFAGDMAAGLHSEQQALKALGKSSSATLAMYYVGLAEYDRAESILDELEQEMRARGRRGELSMVENTRGEIAMGRGEPSAAAPHFARALELSRSVGGVTTWFEIGHGRALGAAGQLERSIAVLRACTPRSTVAQMVQALFLALSLARAGRIEEANEELVFVESRAMVTVQADIARAMVELGDALGSTPRLARRAYRLAKRQLAQLDEPELLRRAEAGTSGAATRIR